MRKITRNPNGQFAKTSKLVHGPTGWTYCISQKGYPRFTSGPYRHMYVHRHEASVILGRELRKDEQVHHGRGGKMCFEHWNLRIVGEREHGWLSAKQAFWMGVLDVRAEKEFYEVLAQLEAEGVRVGV